jgi:hypothetical protein
LIEWRLKLASALRRRPCKYLQERYDVAVLRGFAVPVDLKRLAYPMPPIALIVQPSKLDHDI